MQYLQPDRNSSATYPPPQSTPFLGAIELTDAQADVLVAYNGFVSIEQDGETVSVIPDTEAWEAWKAENAPEPIINTIRAEKLREISTSGNVAITNGITVTLPSTQAAEHFSLEETDQINLTTALAATEQGSAAYPYHADGQLCRIYPAEDIMAISQAAVQHKLYHTTYCNHLLMWARRAETIEELNSITYGSELPKDLGNNMKQVLEAMGVEWKVPKE